MWCGTGHTYVVLVTRTRRNQVLRYRLVRPNSIFQPLQAAYHLRNKYKKVRHGELQLLEARIAIMPLELTGDLITPELKTVPAIW